MTKTQSEILQRRTTHLPTRGERGGLLRNHPLSRRPWSWDLRAVPRMYHDVVQTSWLVLSENHSFGKSEITRGVLAGMQTAAKGVGCEG